MRRVMRQPTVQAVIVVETSISKMQVREKSPVPISERGFCFGDAVVPQPILSWIKLSRSGHFKNSLYSNS